MKSVSVASMVHSVVSAGDTRLFGGIGLGVANARRFAMVVLVGELRFTLPPSASVPAVSSPA